MKNPIVNASAKIKPITRKTIPSIKFIPAEYEPITTANALTVENIVPIIEPKYNDPAAKAGSNPLFKKIGINIG